MDFSQQCLLRPSSSIPPRLGRVAAVCFSFLIWAAPAAGGQEQQKAPAPARPTLKISVEIVNVYAVVREKKGRLIPNLNKEDFEVTEDNASQEIRYFSRETDTPLTLGVLVDTSPSQQRVLSIEKEEAKKFLAQVLRPKDMAFVLHFDLEVELLQDFTSDARLLSRAIDETVINGGGHGVLPEPLPGKNIGGTHLYDAVYLASNELMRNEVGRKVLILLTDGEDEGSEVKLNAALEAAQKTDLIIYSVDIVDRAFYFGRGIGFSGDSVLRKLSEETGGRVIQVSRAKDTAAAFQQIAEEMRTQYLIGYTPSTQRNDGSYHKIRVRVRQGDYKVQARRGYYAPSE
jgi:VWFA-related protein